MTNTKSTRPRHRGVNTKLRNCPALALETRCVFSCQSIQTKPSKSPRSKIRTSSFSSSSFNYSVESSACYPCVEESGALIYQWRDRSALLKSANNHAVSLKKLVDCADCGRFSGLMRAREFYNERATLLEQPWSNPRYLLFEICEDGLPWSVHLNRLHPRTCPAL
jgi:hypothetical protein